MVNKVNKEINDKYVIFLSSKNLSIENAGSKGLNLSKIKRIGIPVPDGFVVTTKAYEHFLNANKLGEKINKIFKDVTFESLKSIDKISKRIHRLFQEAVIPEDVALSILKGYKHLCEEDQLVAVRSSATAEDLPDASFAGQQETFLNVKGTTQLLRAVKRCWASIWTPRAIAYRKNIGMKLTKVKQAIVVQKMVHPDYAGVLFTINPVTGNPEEVVINAARGIGKTVVEGHLTPDNIVVDKKHKHIKTTQSKPSIGERKCPSSRVLKTILSKEKILKLVEIGCEIEKNFLSPQDIEWAFEGDQLYILQTRPITTVVSSGTNNSYDDEWPPLSRNINHFDLWSQVNVGEVWPQPVTPLTWSMIPNVLNTSAQHLFSPFRIPYISKVEWVKRFYGRVYFNEGAMKYILSREFGLPSSFIDAAFGARKNEILAREKVNFLVLLRRLPASTWRLLTFLRSSRRIESQFHKVDLWLKEFENKNLEIQTDEELLEEFKKWEKRFRELFTRYTEINPIVLIIFSLLRYVVNQWRGSQEPVHDLIAGISGLVVAEIKTSLWKIAKEIKKTDLVEMVLKSEPTVIISKLRGNQIYRMLEEFLEKYGHHCPNELEYLNPRWREKPEQVIELLRRYITEEEKINPLHTRKALIERRKKIINKIESELNILQKIIFRQLLSRVEKAVRYRDNTRNYITKITFPPRKILFTIAQRWSSQGLIKNTEDFFFLSLGEIEEIIKKGISSVSRESISKIVSKRRRAYNRWFDIIPPEILGPDGKLNNLSISERQNHNVLYGIPASSGWVKGRARIIRNPDEAIKLEAEDILVTRATDSGWTPLFPLVGGIVVEVGGQLSHAAIIAREYGVPAVVNVENATTIIKDGQTIVVDGTSGCVYLIG